MYIDVLATPHHIVVLVFKHLIRAGDIFGVLQLLPLSQDNGGLKQKHSPLVFGHLHQNQVPLSQDLPLIINPLLREGGAIELYIPKRTGIIIMCKSTQLVLINK